MLSANSATLVYGDTGTGKTTLMATYFEWVYSKYKKKSRYYSGDLGGFGDLMLGLQAAGIVEVCRFPSIDPDGTGGLPIGVCAKITQGWWPEEGAWDPETGLCQRGATLVAPAQTWWLMICKNGHVAKKAMTQTLLIATPCPTCKALTNKESCKEIKKEVIATAGFEDIGAVGYDSLTSMSEWCMTDLNYRAGQGTLGGMKGNINTIVSAGQTFGTGGMAAVGFAQNRVPDWPRNAVNIPGLVVPPIFTALEKKVTDSETKLPIYGPQVAGSAKTSEVPSYFGNCWPTAKVVGEDQKETHRLYLTGYRNPGDATPHAGKSRVSPGSLPEYLEDPPGATTENGKSFSLFNLGYVFDLLETAQKKEAERIKEKYKDAPGLKKGVVLKEKEDVNAPVEEVQSAPPVTTPVTPSVLPSPVVPSVAFSGGITTGVPKVGGARIVVPPVVIKNRGVIPLPKKEA